MAGTETTPPGAPSEPPGFLETLRILAPYFAPQRARILPGAVLVLAAAAASVVVPLAWRALIDDVLVGGARDAAPLVLLVLAGAELVRFNAHRFGWYLVAIGFLRFEFGLRVGLHKKLLAQSMAYHLDRRKGDLVQRVMGDVSKVAGGYRTALMHGAEQTLHLTLAMLAIGWMSPALLLLVTLPAAAAVLALRRQASWVTVQQAVIRDQTGRISARLDEDLAGLAVLKAFGREARQAAAFGRETEATLDSREGLAIRLEVFYGIFQGVGTLSSLALVVLGSLAVLEGRLSVGSLVACKTLWDQLWWPLWYLGAIWGELLDHRAAVARVFAVLEAPEPISFPAEGPAVGAGRIRFEGIGFEYRPGTPVLAGIDLTIEPGSRVALVGPSGAGKSSLLKLLLRFQEPSRGRITLDGEPLDRYPLAALRSAMAVVDQDPFLFHWTVRENLVLARPDADPAALAAAVARAGCAEFVAALPEGLDTLVGERGGKLSGGQRQRLCIARAFLAEPRILLLDEATASVDAAREAEIEAALDALMAGRTTLMVTHKLALARRCDRIAVLVDGRIEALGTHAELMAADGWYSRTWALQEAAAAGTLSVAQLANSPASR